MKSNAMKIHVLLPCLLLAGFAGSALPADDEVFAIQGGAQLTQSELDAAFAEIPEEHRLAFIRDGARVDQLVQNLLRRRQFAQAAREAGFDQQALTRSRMNLAAEERLASAWMEQVVADAPAADYDALAEEYYLANPDEFMTPEILDVSHILVSTETRSEEDGLALIEEVASRLATDPGQFDALVAEFSEDPAKVSNQGRYPQMKRGDMVKPFEEAAFALQQPGEISDPVKTSYGYHLIRLNRRAPPERMDYALVKDRLLEFVEKNYLADYRERYIRNLSSDPIEIPEGAVEAMAKRYFGEDLELAPAFEER